MRERKIMLHMVGDIHLISLRGNLTTNGDGQILQDVLKGLPSSPENSACIILEMSQAEDIDKEAIEVISLTAHRAKKDKNPLRIVGANDHHKELFRINGMDQQVEMFKTLKEARESFSLSVQRE